MRDTFARIVGVLALATAASGQPYYYGTPVISSVQSSLVDESPKNIQTITSGTKLTRHGFLIYLNGSFSPYLSVRWVNPVTSQSLTLESSYSPTQIRAFVPEALYLTPVASTQTVNIVLIEQQGGEAAALPQATQDPVQAQFFLSAPLSQPTVMPIGTVGAAYSASIISGGTPPYAVGEISGTVPPGLTPGADQQHQLLAGTPTAAGVYTFSPVISDQWGNTASGAFTVQIIGGATITSILPNSVPAGSGAIQIAINGTNFVSPQSPAGGSQVLWKFNNVFTNLSTTFVSDKQLLAFVPASLLGSTGLAAISVLQPNDSVSAPAAFAMLAPIITSLAPSSIPAGSGPLTLNILGSNFLQGVSQTLTAPSQQPQVQFGATLLPAVFVNSGSLTVQVPGNLLAAPGSIPVTVINPGGTTSNTVNFTVTASLAILTTGLPGGTSGVDYLFHVTATGGSGAYTWSAGGLPPGLGINPSSGDINGRPLSTGTFTIGLRVADAQGSSAQTTLPLTVALPPPTITTPSLLPSGTVGVPYVASLGASGSGTYTFSLKLGALPDGLTLSQDGFISGTPKTASTFNFEVVANDGNGNAPSKGFTIVIAPAPLVVPSGPTDSMPVGTPITIDFTPTGGVKPYRFNLNCTLPQGLTFSNGLITGTPTTPGAFACRLVVLDAVGGSVTRDFTITVTAPPLVLQGIKLPGGQVGVAYKSSVAATGGLEPIKYSATGVPAGLILAETGAITGTPTKDGAFTITVTATDGTSAKMSAPFEITIAPATLTVIATPLPDGAVGAAYSASLAPAASGGLPPYTWTVTGLPVELTASSAGVISGTPAANGALSLNATVKDSAGATASGTFTLKVAPATLVITTAAMPNGVVGVAYALTFASSGGATPIRWSASGLPAGVVVSTDGVVSGTPTAPGPATITVSAADALGTTVSKTFAISVALPAIPPLSFAGVNDTSNPLQQPRLSVSLGSPFPVDVVVTLTLTFAPDAGPDDPSILFSSGGRTAQVTVPAGATTSLADVGVQTGSVAGLITITAQLQAAGQDVTPQPPPRRTVRINAAAPTISSATGTRTATGFTITVTGLVTSREITQAVFQFNAAPGSNLQTTTLTVPVEALFSSYFGTAQAAPAGGQFVFTQPFTINGSPQAIVSVTVTLVNRVGSSSAVTVNLN
jgi:large repetitive protein